MPKRNPRILLPVLCALLGACTRPDSTGAAVDAASSIDPQAPATEVTTPTSPPVRGQSIRGAVQVGDDLRTYRLYVPDSLEPADSAALVVALHGGGGNAANLERHVHLNALAEEEGFIVVYPNGTGRSETFLLTWNAGKCCGLALDNQVDDAAFLRALVDHLDLSLAIDPRRVYATGMSNGGMMAYRLACEASDVFAAVAPVAGALNLEDCDPVEPVSVMAIQGTDDQHVRFEGGPPEVSLDSHERIDRSVDSALAFWAARDGCSLTPMTQQQGDVRHEAYLECEPGLGVELVAIDGGGHAWPGGTKFTSRGDEPSQALDASQAIWDFFESHPKP